MERDVQNGRTGVKHGEGIRHQFTFITDADNAHTVENLKKLNFEVLAHLLYSLDLTPSDSTGPLKQALRGRRFTMDQQLDVTVGLSLSPKRFTLRS
jgi:hypothetical protein